MVRQFKETSIEGKRLLHLGMAACMLLLVMVICHAEPVFAKNFEMDLDANKVTYTLTEAKSGEITFGAANTTGYIYVGKKPDTFVVKNSTDKVIRVGMWVAAESPVTMSWYADFGPALTSQTIGRSATAVITGQTAKPGEEVAIQYAYMEAENKNVKTLPRLQVIAKITVTDDPVYETVINKAPKIDVTKMSADQVGIQVDVNNGGADKQINLLLHDLPPDLRQLLLGHLAVGKADTGLRNAQLPSRGHPLDILHAVVEVVNLAAAPQLTPDGVGQDAVVVLEDIGLHRVAILRGLLDDGHIADAAHRHIEGARDRRGGQGQHIDIRRQLLDAFLLRNAEALLLVNNKQAEIVEFHVLGQHPVRPDHNIHLSVAQPLDGLLLLLRRAEAGEHLDGHRKALEPLQQCVVMLQGKDGSRHKQYTLLALRNTFEGGAERHLRLAEADVAAQQTVHRNGALHIVLDLLRAAELIVGLLIFKPPLKIVLPFLVRPEGKAGGRHPLRIKRNELLGNVAHRRAHPRLGFLPFLPAEPVQADGGLLAGSDVFGHQIQLRDRHVQRVSLVVLQLEIILGNPLHRQRMDSLIQPDAVRRVNHVIARLQLGQTVNFTALVADVALFAAPASIGAPVCNDGKAGVRELRAGRKPAAQHRHMPRCQRGGRGSIQRRNPGLCQILRQRDRVFLLRPAQHRARRALCSQRGQVLTEQVKSPGPDRKLPRGDGDQGAQLQIVPRARKHIHQNAAPLQQPGHLVPVQLTVTELAADFAAFEQALHLLLHLPFGGAQPFLGLARLGQQDQRIRQIVKQGGKVRIEQ